MFRYCTGILTRGGGPTMEYHQQRYARALDDAILPGCHWLDLGAGTRIHGGWSGVAPGALAARAARLVGIDVAAPHLARHPHLTERIVGVGEALPFADASFDVVTANMVLEHLADPAAVFREIARVLRPGGRFVFVTPHRGHPLVATASVILHPRLRSLWAERVEGRPAEHVFPTYYRANTRAAIARAAGAFRTVLVERFASFPICQRLPLLREVERAAIRLAELPWGAHFRSNILGVLERPGVTSLSGDVTTLSGGAGTRFGTLRGDGPGR